MDVKCNAAFLNSVCVALVLVSAPTQFARSQQSNLVLKDGMTIGPGVVASEVSLTPRGSVNDRAEVATKPMVFLNDGLRRTYANSNRVAAQPPAPALIRIRFESNESLVTDGTQGIPISGVAKTTPFDLFGRRFYLTPTPKGVIRFVQGITEVSPNYVKVQSLKTEKDKYEWDMRLPLESFDSDTLMSILAKNASQEKPGDWLDIVNLFSSAKRFLEARKMLERAIHKFPELDNQRPQLKQFDQLMADQLFSAAQLAQDSKQYQFSKLILDNINKPVLSLETQLKVEGKLETIEKDQRERVALVGWIREDTSKLVDGDIKTQLQSVLPEIEKNLSLGTAARFADYLRRRSDKTLKPEQLAAIAISGWIFGPAIGEDNSAVVSSGVKARKLITDYLSDPVRNDQLVEELARLESGSPRLVAKILENMAPPVPTPPTAAVSKSVSASDESQPPKTIVIPGRFLLEVPQIGKNRGRTTRYLVQLPPEYNPFQRYPCVLTLPSELSTIEEQLNWWVGPFAPESPDQRCLGEATKRGYIVVSPEWAEPMQPTYNFTENEHANILGPLRDAMQRFNIDSDRIYISGHFMGATAAWDIALAHPDMWAGCIAIGPSASKFIKQYWSNSEYVPSYFVAGEMDPSIPQNAPIWDKYLDRWQIDSLVTLYQGRGIDPYLEELPRIMEWMSLPTKVRNVAPKELKAVTSRAGDRFFWWFETGQLNQEKLVHPLKYKPGDEYEIKSSINSANNAIKLSTVPAKKFTVWLGPEFVDFSRDISIDKAGDRRRVEPKPDIRTMLEDARGRADRQHPFWMRVDFP